MVDFTLVICMKTHIQILKEICSNMSTIYYGRLTRRIFFCGFNNKKKKKVIKITYIYLMFDFKFEIKFKNFINFNFDYFFISTKIHLRALVNFNNI